MKRHTLHALATTAVLASALLLAVPASASASPAWTVRTSAAPSQFAPSDATACANEEKCNTYAFSVLNSGNEVSAPGVTLTDTLPAGIAPAGIEGEGWGCSEAEVTSEHWVVTCEFGEAVPAAAYASFLEIRVSAPAEGSSGPFLNKVSVSGGGATVPGTSSLSTSLADGTPHFGVTDFSVQATNPDGGASEAAGGHPWQLTTSFGIPWVAAPANINGQYFTPVENLKKAVVELPLGFAGNPLSAERCDQIDFNRSKCPADSRVGSFAITAGLFISPRFHATGEPNGQATAVYNVTPERGYPAEFGIRYLQRSVYLYATVIHSASGDRLRITVPGIPPLLGTDYVSLTIWGEPGQFNGSGSEAAFLTNPASCAAASSPARIELESWESSEPVSAETIPYPQLKGCDQLTFEPSLGLLPETGAADSPTGLNVDLNSPQTAQFEERATPQLRDATVALPEGLSADPALADGLGACAATGPEGINLGTTAIGPFGQDLGNPFATEFAAGHLGGNASPYDDGVYHTTPGRCPFASTLGTAEVTSPVVSEPLTGHVYLGTPDCSPCTDKDAREGKLIKLYIEVAGNGVIAKLPGSVSADPVSGRLTASFKENPQLPFEDLKLSFFGGARAALSTPPTCGTYTTTSDLKPWSAPETPDATPTSGFKIGSGSGGGACANAAEQEPNAPSFTAGSLTPTAGDYSPFELELSRADGSQRLKGIDTTLPAGLVAKLAGVPYCSEVQITAAAAHSGAGERVAPSCPAASEVGTVNVGAGAGPNPFHVSGHAYLAGPYKGAPISLAILTPAVAGPFDLGTVAVRTALYVNSETAVVTARSDPFPQILAGIPLDLRSVAVSLSRPGFTLNPTSCNPMAVTGNATSVLGQSAALLSPFQVGGCPALGFKPKLALKLKGATKRTGNPALTATVTYPNKGAYANIARAQVTLPHSEFLDNAHIGTVCTRVQFAEGQTPGEKCPPASIYGKASAITPLLDQPLSGPVYLRSSSHELPDLVAALNGQINIVLAGRVDSGKGGGLRNTFEVVPDAPVSRFALEMRGGKKGLLQNSENICRKPQHAVVHLVAQSGRVSDTTPVVTNSCPKKKAHKHHSSH